MRPLEKHFCPYCMSPVPPGESCPACRLTAGNYVPSPHHLPPGTVLLDRYLVGRVLGEGGFGITYIGCDLRLELKVAIKEYYPVDRATRNASASLEVTSFIGPSARSFERGKHKFLGEAQVMARMDKQQVIVGVRDFFEVNNTAYIVMEYIEGTTFRDLVEQRGGGIPPDELFVMLEPLFKALSHMHEAGLIHRDISPDNLMLESGRVRLLDFGCAREAAHGTETMTIALKHGYAPLEQYQQKGQGPWTDIYALCATIYYCLTGKAPPQALDRIAEDNLLLPSKLGIPIAPRQEQALLKGLSIQPRRRFQTVEELHAALYGPEEAPVEPTGPAPEARTLYTGGMPPAVPPAASAPRMPGTDGGQPPEAAQAADTGRSACAPASVPPRRTGGPAEGPAPVQTADVRAAGIPVTQPAPARTDIPAAGIPVTEPAPAPAAAPGGSGRTQQPPPGGGDIPPADTARPQTPTPPEGTAHTEYAEAPEAPADEAAPAPAPARAKPAWAKYLPAGIAAALAVAGLGWWALRPGSAPAGQTGPTSPAVSAAQPASASSEELEEEPPHTVSFDGATVVTEENVGALQALMEDTSVPSIVLDMQGDITLGGRELTKPVKIAEGTTVRTSGMTITDTGYLQVDGELSLSGFLRVEGSSTHLYVTENGWYEVDADASLVWVDERESIAFANGQRRDMSYVIECSESVFDDAVHVTTLEQLRAAADDRQAVVIDADITLSDGFGFSSPVKISEGVTVNTQDVGSFNLNAANVGQGTQSGVLFNYGTLTGGLYADGSSSIINYGTLNMTNDTDYLFCSLWLEEQARLLNLGTLNANNCSRLWDDSFCMNLGPGTVNAYDFLLVGGNMTNRGKINVEGDDNGQNFTLANGSVLYNDGTLTVKDGGHLRNLGWVCNRGILKFEYGSKVENAVLENTEALRSAGYKADYRVEVYGAGVWFYRRKISSVSVPIGNLYAAASAASSLPFYDTRGNADGPEGDEVIEVRTAEELNRVLDNDLKAIIYLTADLTLDEGLTLSNKILYLGAELDIPAGAELKAYNCSIILMEGAGRLSGSKVSLSEGTNLKVSPGASLSVSDSLKLDNALLWGEDGEVLLDNTSLVLKNKAAVALASAETFSADGASITVQSDSMFTTPYAAEMTLSGATLTLEDGGWMRAMQDLTLNNCVLRIENGGMLWSSAKNLTLRSSTVTIAKGGEWNSEFSNVSLLSNSKLENRGHFSVSGWDEHTFTLHGTMTNYGDAYLYTRSEIDTPIQNQGRVFADGRLDPAMVQGNPPQRDE